MYDIFTVREMFENTKGKSEALNRKETDNTTTKRKRTDNTTTKKKKDGQHNDQKKKNRQHNDQKKKKLTIIYITLNRKKRLSYTIPTKNRG
jgi:hypothetical protein